ncbi:MAG: phosphopantetheine-binding protein [Oscillospiraceae bacterium]|nr:phosphopantetheine-binding protein [Oscillospiraceae bacterium]
MSAFEKLSSILVEQFGISKESISTTTPIEELGLDSLEIMDLVVILEDEFGVSIDDNQIYASNQLGELVNFIERGE